MRKTDYLKKSTCIDRRDKSPLLKVLLAYLKDLLKCLHKTIDHMNKIGNCQETTVQLYKLTTNIQFDNYSSVKECIPNKTCYYPINKIHNLLYK